MLDKILNQCLHQNAHFLVGAQFSRRAVKAAVHLLRKYSALEETSSGNYHLLLDRLHLYNLAYYCGIHRSLKPHDDNYEDAIVVGSKAKLAPIQTLVARLKMQLNSTQLVSSDQMHSIAHAFKSTPRPLSLPKSSSTWSTSGRA